MATLARPHTAGAAVGPSTGVIGPRFAAVMGATFAYFTAFGMLLPTVPLFVEGPLGGGGGQVGLAVGAFSIAALVARPFAGLLGDRGGRRLLMTCGAGVAAVSTAALVAAHSVALLVVLRLLAGLGEAAFFVGAVAAAGDLAPTDRRGEAMSLFSLALYGGIAIGPATGERLLASAGFPGVWLMSGALALVAAAVAGAAPGRPSPSAAARAGVRGAPRRRLLHPAGLLPGALMALVTVALAAFNAFVPLHAPEVGLDGSGGAFLLFAVIVLGIRGLGARIPDRLGPDRTAPAALALLAAGMALMGLWPTTAGLLAGTVVFATGNALAFPSLSALALRRAAPQERGVVLGTFTAFIDLGFGAGAIGLGAVAAAAGQQAVFLAAALTSSAGLALLAARLRPASAAPREPASRHGPWRGRKGRRRPAMVADGARPGPWRRAGTTASPTRSYDRSDVASQSSGRPR